MKKYAAASLTVALALAGFYLRWHNAHADLGSPSVDENDVVQQGVAFMDGEWRYYLPEYGALPMYGLAALYRLVALLHGQTALEYAARVFYDGAEQYLLARLICVASYVPLAIVSYRYLAPRFGRSAGTISALLLSLPILDRLTKSTVRIDVAQGAFQLLALLFLVKTLDGKSWRNWLAAGVFAGLAMASKPMPGALIAPCFWAASWFAATLERPAPPGGVPSQLRGFGQRLWRSLYRPQLWLSGAAALLVAVLANPSALDLRAFIDAQLQASQYYSGASAPGGHRTAFEVITVLGPPFTIAIALSVLAMPFVRDARARLIALFPLVYTTAFWGRPVRFYYMVAPAMALCWVVAIGAGLVLCRLGLDAPADARSSSGGGSEPAPVASAAPRARAAGVALSLLLVLVLAWLPVRELSEFARTISPQTLAREWIHRNIPSGTRLFHYGTYAGGPRLVAASWKAERKITDFFEYGRYNYVFYERAARKAYEDYRSQGRPYYEIEMFNESPAIANRSRNWLSRSLASHAVKNGQEYILLANYRASEYRTLGYSWFDSVELAQEFGNLAIFRVPKPVAPRPAADTGSGASGG
ncbi:MAG TPA: glycosyltransferase family 39 protein [Polyangiaceae bacterium]|nr:glycosyltransferase family 39 protein [Polyangiaceae bacterium]